MIAGETNVFTFVYLCLLLQVLHQVHPNLSAEDDALSRVECLCIRLLGMLCAKPPPHTIQDIEDRVARTLPTLIDKWALAEAREQLDKSKRKKLVLPFNQIQNLLQKVNSITKFEYLPIIIISSIKSNRKFQFKFLHHFMTHYAMMTVCQTIIIIEL